MKKIIKGGIGLLVAGGLVTGIIGVRIQGKVCGYSETNMWDNVNAYNDKKSKELEDEGCKRTNAETKSEGSFCTEIVITCIE